MARLLGFVSMSALAVACSGDSDDADDDAVGMQNDDAQNDDAESDDAEMQDESANDDEETSGAGSDEATSDDSDGEDTSDESDGEDTSDESDDGAADDTDEEPEEEPSTPSTPSTPSEVPEFDASVDSDTLLVDLSSAQLEQLCLETEEYVNGDALAVAQCEMFGALLAAFGATNDSEYQAACVQYRDECLAEPPSAEEQDFDCDEDPNFVAECTATVGDYEECMSSLFASAFVTCDTPFEEAVEVLESANPEDPTIDSAACDRLDACEAE